MTSQRCTTCGGSGFLSLNSGQKYTCPNCEGTGKQFDPGRLFLYEAGPFTLNAPAAVSPSLPQYFVGAAINAAALNGVTCQVTGRPFRWMFALAKSTFPFTSQTKDAGSGTGRSFCPQQLQVHSQNFWGTAEHPLPLVTPYVFDLNVQITIDVTDLVGAVGTCGVTNGSPTVTWVSGGGSYGNGFNTAGPPYNPNYNGLAQAPIWNGATISIGGVNYVISNALGSGVTSQNSLTLASNYTGANNAAIAFSVSNTVRLGFLGVELSS